MTWVSFFGGWFLESGAEIARKEFDDERFR